MRVASAALAGFMLAGPVATSAQVKAFTVPISSDRIVLRVTTAEGTPAQLTVLNGGLARVARAGGPVVGLTTVLRDGWLELVVSVITKDAATGNEAIAQVARLRLELNLTVHIDQGDASFDVSWLATLPAAVTSPTPSIDDCTSCCVTCGSDTYCGCAVQTECGSCCCRHTCPCDSHEAPGSGTGARCSAAKATRTTGPR